MPNTITFEREKLNQAMYQKLKKFIMNKRKREAEERAQEDYYKRLKKEHEDRKRLIQFSTESLENARREIVETKKRLATLKAEKDELFTRFKQITQEVKHRDADSRARNQQMQLPKSSVYPEQLQSRNTQDALYLLSKATNRNLGNRCSQDVINQINVLRKQIVQLYGFNQYTQGSSSSHTSHESQIFNQSHNVALGAYELPDKRQLSQPQQQQHQPPPKNTPADILSSTLLGTREMSAQEYQNISKYLAEYTASGGKLQNEADILNAINAGLFLSNTKLSQQQSTSAATGQLTTTARGSTGPSASSSSVVGYLLPPAPTGYRGSITTGQSAQQIQLAQQQQQAAAAAAVAAAAAQLYGGSLDGFPNISSG